MRMETVLKFFAAYSVLFVILIVWRRKTSASILPFILGIVSYMCISLFRGLTRGIILNESVQAHVVLYYVLSAILSGVFEEGGRYVVFRPFIGNWVDCVSYGIGHSAAETLLTHRFWEGDIWGNLFISYDLIVYISFSVAMSALVFVAANYADNKKFLLAAVALHTAIDIVPIGFFQGKMTIGEIMLIDLLFVAGCCYFAFRVYQHFRDY